MQCVQEIIDHTANIQSFIQDHDSCYIYQGTFFFEPANFRSNTVYVPLDPRQCDNNVKYEQEQVSLVGGSVKAPKKYISNFLIW